VTITVTLTSVTSVAPFEKEELEKMLDLVNNIEGSSGKQSRSQFTLLMLFLWQEPLMDRLRTRDVLLVCLFHDMFTDS
jgi:hypothetical protein